MWTLIKNKLATWVIRALLPECQQCGICCAPGRWAGPNLRTDSYADIKPKDLLRFKRRWQKNHVAPDGKSMLMVLDQDGSGQRCSALKGTPGKVVSCEVYKDRPGTCRAFERGGPQCIGILKQSLLPKERRTKPW